jgi:hypothetical protein
VDPRVETPASQTRRLAPGADPLLTGTGGGAGTFRRSRPSSPVADPLLAAVPTATAVDERPGTVTVVEAAPAPAAPAHTGVPAGAVAAPPAVAPPAEPEVRPPAVVPDVATAPVPVVVPVPPVTADVAEPTTGATRMVPAPKPRAIVRWRRRRPRVRRVTRVVRRVDAWTVFKVATIFWVVLYAILLVAGVLLWNLAVTTGTVSNVEGFIKDLFGLETFTFDGQQMFRASWVLGVFFAVAGTGLTVTLAVVFNLIADLVGGIRVTVLEEEVVLRDRPAVVAARDTAGGG